MLKRFWNDESGATAIEYGLIAALVAVALIAGAKMVGTELDSTFVAVGTELQTARQ
jgi:pilus assembly protein Flp/PilA